MAELIERYLARDPNGVTLYGGWIEIQHTAQTVFEMSGQQSRMHFHASGDPCNLRCDIHPPLPEPKSPQESPQVVAKAEPVTACAHGVSLDRDCGQCLEEARMGLRREMKPVWGGPNERPQ